MTAELPTKWPRDLPSGWHHRADEFLRVVVEHPFLWLRLSKAKYLDIRVDTRDGGFTLRDRDGNLMDPEEVIAACRESVEQFGDAAHEPYRKSVSQKL